METNPENLIRALSVVIAKEHNYTLAAEALDLDTYPAFKTENGGTLEDWKHDIKLQLTIINQDKELKELKEFKKEATEFMTESEKKEIFIAKYMGKFL